MEIDKAFYSRGVKLRAVAALPDGAGPALPAVVLCHGHSRHKNDGLDRLSALLCEAGFFTLRFDFRGCGADAAARYGLYCGTDWSEDLISAVSFLKTIPMVDPARIGAVGISMGASTVVNTAGMDKRIKSIAAMAGIGDCESWLRWVWEQNGGDFDAFCAELEHDSQITAATGSARAVEALDMYHKPEADKRALREESFLNSAVGSYVTLNSLWSLLRFRPLDRCPDITVPAFFAHGGRDDIVPLAQSQRMFAAVRSEKKQLREYPGMEHNLPMDPARDTVFHDIVDWLTDTL